MNISVSAGILVLCNILLSYTASPFLAYKICIFMFFKYDLVISSLVTDLAYPLISKCFIPLKDVKFTSSILVFIKYLQSKEQICLILIFFSQSVLRA